MEVEKKRKEEAEKEEKRKEAIRAAGGTMIQSGKKGKPGIIFGRISKQQRNGVRNERQLNLVVPRY